MTYHLKQTRTFAVTANPLRVARRGLGFERLEQRYVLHCGAVSLLSLETGIFTDTLVPTAASQDADGLWARDVLTCQIDTSDPVATKIEARRDSFSEISGDTSISLDIFANDQLPDGSEFVSMTEARVGSVSIDLGGNVAVYTPLFGHEYSDHFQYTVRDADGIESTAHVTIGLTPPKGPAIDVTIDIVSTGGKALDAVRSGDQFLVNVFVQDVREVRLYPGVFSFYVDVSFDPTIANIQGDVQFGEAFPNARTSSVASGRVEHLGAVAGLDPTGTDRLLLATIPMVARQAGDLELSLSPTIDMPYEPTVYGWDLQVGADRIKSGSEPFEVIASLAKVAEEVAEQGVPVSDELDLVAPILATLNSPADPLALRATQFDVPDAEPVTEADGLESMRTTGLLKLERDAAVLVAAFESDHFPHAARDGHSARDSIMAARPNDQGWQEDAVLDLLTLEAELR